MKPEINSFLATFTETNRSGVTASDHSTLDTYDYRNTRIVVNSLPSIQNDNSVRFTVTKWSYMPVGFITPSLGKSIVAISAHPSALWWLKVWTNGFGHLKMYHSSLGGRCSEQMNVIGNENVKSIPAGLMYCLLYIHRHYNANPMRE